VTFWFHAFNIYFLMMERKKEKNLGMFYKVLSNLIELDCVISVFDKIKKLNELPPSVLTPSLLQEAVNFSPSAAIRIDICIEQLFKEHINTFCWFIFLSSSTTVHDSQHTVYQIIYCSNLIRLPIIRLDHM